MKWKQRKGADKSQKMDFSGDFGAQRPWRPFKSSLVALGQCSYCTLRWLRWEWPRACAPLPRRPLRGAGMRGDSRLARPTRSCFSWPAGRTALVLPVANNGESRGDWQRCSVSRCRVTHLRLRLKSIKARSVSCRFSFLSFFLRFN